MVLLESVSVAGGVAAVVALVLRYYYEVRLSLSKPTRASPVLQLEGCVSSRRARGSRRRLYFSAVLIGEPQSGARNPTLPDTARQPASGPGDAAHSRAVSI